MENKQSFYENLMKNAIVWRKSAPESDNDRMWQCITYKT